MGDNPTPKRIYFLLSDQRKKGSLALVALQQLAAFASDWPSMIMMAVNANVKRIGSYHLHTYRPPEAVVAQQVHVHELQGSMN